MKLYKASTFYDDPDLLFVHNTLHLRKYVTDTLIIFLSMW